MGHCISYNSFSVKTDIEEIEYELYDTAERESNCEEALKILFALLILSAKTKNKQATKNCIS